MKEITLMIGGVAFAAGVITGSGTVYVYYNNRTVTCKCKKIEGEIRWTGKNCPKKVRKALKETYGGTCP